MKQQLSIVLVYILLIGCQKNGSDEKKVTVEQDQIKQKTEEVFNDNNPSLWSSNPTYVNLSTHETVQGKDEIVNYLKKHFTKKVVLKSEKVVLQEDKASDVGEIQDVSGYKAEYVKENGKWVINKLLEVSFEKAPSNYEHLKEIEWLVGKWNQEGEFAEVRYDGAFDVNKNFLTMTFNIDILGHHEMSGHQIIGWDPNEKKIRSWIYDSDGSFGEGHWVKSGDTWLVSFLFTLPDGRLGTATQVYKKVDDNTFTFESINRDINGKLLPNVGPFKIVRER